MDETYQARVRTYIERVCQGDPTDLDERRDRFLEEAIEVYQALGGQRRSAYDLARYVFDSAPGTPHRELGQAQMTLAALATEAGESIRDCGEDELTRVSTPEMVERIRGKRSRRAGRGPLPGLRPEDMRVATPEEIAADKTRIATSPGGEMFVTGHLNDCALASAAVARMDKPPPPGTRIDPRNLVSAPRDGSAVLLVHICPSDLAECVAEWGWYESGPADRCWYGWDNERINPTHWISTKPGDAPPYPGEES